MDMQNVAKLDIPEGEVRTIHDKDGDLIWGKVSYGVKYKGDTAQDGTPTPSAPVAVQTVTGENVVKISDGQGNEQNYEVNLGKNLFDKSTVTLGYRFGSDGALYADAACAASDYIPIKASTTYTYSRGASGNSAACICYYDSSKTFISRTMPIISQTATSGSITSPSGAVYARIADNKTLLDSMQLELGSTATSYADYFEPIMLCKIGSLQDYIYKSGDKWYIHEEIGKVDLSTLTWSATTGSIRGATAPNAKYVSSNTQVGNAMTDGYKVRQGSGLGNAGVGWFAVDTAKFNFNTGSSKNPTGMLYYALATPTDTEITNETLVGQLEAVEQWLTRYGYNAAVSGNLPIIIDRTAL